MQLVRERRDHDRGRRRVDFVLGDCHGTACAPVVTDMARQALADMGYAVTRNAPYAGGFTTRHYGRPHDGVHALQIEINRSLYMDEKSFTRAPGLGELARCMRGLAESIAGLLGRLPHVLLVNLSRPRPELEERVRDSAREDPRVQWLRAVPLERLIAHISLCEGLITVDAGPQHLAHALDVPSLTLFGPMDERRWADRWARPMHQTLRGGPFDLTPEERRGLPENHLMRLIEPEALLARVETWRQHLNAGRGNS